jgi:D-sedoheptulose 7-phosphate isomerase
MDHIERYLEGARRVLKTIDRTQVAHMIEILKDIKREKGRLFFLGVGGSAANASHAVNDFRKICGFEAYAPTDNVSELSARTNDEGWQTVFVSWLQESRLSPHDGVFILSVGGGNEQKNISANLVLAVRYAQEIRSKVLGIVGRDGGFTARHANAVVLVPPLEQDMITPYTESFQAVLLHLLASHPELKTGETKWESIARGGKNGTIS